MFLTTLYSVEIRLNARLVLKSLLIIEIFFHCFFTVESNKYYQGSKAVFDLVGVEILVKLFLSRGIGFIHLVVIYVWSVIESSVLEQSPSTFPLRF